MTDWSKQPDPKRQIAEAMGTTVQQKVVRGPNKTEIAYAEHLAALQLSGAVIDYKFEPLKLRLADKTWLLVDFIVRQLESDGRLLLVDVKGRKGQTFYAREDAMVKIKTAAEIFRPFFIVAIAWPLANNCWKLKEF